MSSGRRRPRSLYTTLDILTDGSEHTGHGSLFLSVWKGPILPSSSSSSSKTEVNDNDGVVKPTMTEWMVGASLLARYNISGLGDATARLCADQRFKLANVRATFLPSPSSSSSSSSFGSASENADGLSALLYALVGAGSPSLHVVLPPDWRNGKNNDSTAMEEMATLILGKHKHLDIHTCCVPTPSIILGKCGRSDNDKGEAAATATSTIDWWEVYQDEYLQAHAGYYLENVGPNGNDEKSAEDIGDTATPAQHDNHSLLIYLFSFPRHSSGLTTLMVLPPKCHDVTSVYFNVIQKELPLVRDDHRMEVDHVVALDPLVSQPSPLVQLSLSCMFMATLPRTSIDDGVLIRSQQLARYFRQNMPWAFSAPSDPTGRGDHPATASAFRVLKSGTSVILGTPYQSASMVWEDRVIDRRKAISVSSLREEWTSTLESLQSFISQPPSCEDENEIDIDEEDEVGDECDKNQVPSSEETTNTYDLKRGSRLIVLGTGCATPSAYRGSSSYALVRPSIQQSGKETQEIYLLDCGEGTATTLSRSCGPLTDWKRQIRGIWISHAHLDHYGGLPTLLRVLHEAKGRIFAPRHRHEDRSPAKRQKHLHDASVPWVMAPAKVLRYLDILLQSRHGRSTRDNHSQYFHPLLHHDPNIPPGNWIHFENIKVNHSCCPSFGLLLGWKSPGSNEAPIFLCYSGDTRPCFGLVQACRNALRRCHKHLNHHQHGRRRRQLFLIHEATFDDAERDDAEKKKHSTLSEAVQVANDIPASKLLLTHFSQRYVSLSHRTNVGSTSNGGDTIPTGLATDGLWVMLE